MEESLTAKRFDLTFCAMIGFEGEVQMGTAPLLCEVRQ